MDDSQIRVIPGGQVLDDRGSVCFVNDFDFNDVRRMYIVENHKDGFVRAWHGHEKEGKYVFVVRGAIWLAIKPIPDPKNVSNSVRDIFQITLAEEQPSVVWIPPKHAHGFMTMRPQTKVIFFSTATLQESKQDDIRFPAKFWNVWIPSQVRWR